VFFEKTRRFAADKPYKHLKTYIYILDIKIKTTCLMEPEKHLSIEVGLRAAVLGANDGILSTTILVIGVAAASNSRSPVILAAFAGWLRVL
jgi:hypothetical protein